MDNLDKRLTSRDLRHPEIIEDLVKDARVQAFGSPSQIADQLLDRREKCNKRGYHRISSEPKKDDDLMICNDCEVYTSRGFLKGIGMEYKVGPLE